MARAEGGGPLPRPYLRTRRGVPVPLSDARLRLVARLHRSRARVREGLVLVEGVRVAREALAAGADVLFCVLAPRARALGVDDIVAEMERRGIDMAEVDDGSFATLADTATPQGILLVCAEPKWGGDPVPDGPRILALDGVQDPGNAGTLIRSAAAFGWGAVVLLDGSVDPWLPRTVRSSAGAVFRVPVVRVAWRVARAAFERAGTSVLAADPRGVPASRVALPAGAWALVVGSEARGARAAVLDDARALISVPMPGPVESLNAGVAGSILMYALTRGPPHG